MSEPQKQVEADGPAGAPLWMVTFCDAMTLMLTFFVLLFSFSSFNVDVFQKMSMSFTKALYEEEPPITEDKGAFLPTEQIAATEYIVEGSEKITLSEGWESGLKEGTAPTESADFHSRKVFLISSKNVFWGKGTAISFEGRNTLAKMASFLKEVPNRIVISENGPGDDEEDEQLGLLRAWAVMEYLTIKQGLDKSWFSISAASTLTQERFISGEPDQPEAEAERGLEIVLLERSIYN
jgi:chemotaxis protein MotB